MSVPLTPENQVLFTQNVTALVDYLLKSDDPNNQAIANVIRALADECARLAMENARQRTDTELLDWVEKNAGNIDFVILVPAEIWSSSPFIAVGSNFRSAIQSAKRQLETAMLRSTQPGKETGK